MKLNNIGNFNTVGAFVDWKSNKFAKEEKNFQALFENMFSEENNIFAEYSEGSRIRKLTYGQCKATIQAKAKALNSMLQLPKGSVVGLYMDNSIQWIELFWSILMCGYNPLLMNLKLADEILERIISEYHVQAVITDGKKFSVQTLRAAAVQPAGGKAAEATAGSKENRPAEYPAEEWGSEVIFMSSGTTDDNIKLCVYTAENFYYQIGNSADIVKKCPAIAAHVEGELKLLTLLPFYHVFGFIAVYLWFGFFSRTFVFLEDMHPATIQTTVKRHKVTHIFAVPLVWELVYKKALRTIQDKGEGTYARFLRGLRLANSCALGEKMAYGSMGEVREQLFGDSVRFLISGGSFISTEALQFFNGIGYHLANGYGMTEIGITSVEISPRAKIRNLGSIGMPFQHTQYAVSEKGELLIKGRNMASCIWLAGEKKITDYSRWFYSHDLAEVKAGRYYINGRSDDLIISRSGENLNPNLIENSIRIEGIDELCLISASGEPVLLLCSTSCYTTAKVQEIIGAARAELCRLNLQNEIHKVVVTPDKLIESGEFKLNRRKIKNRFMQKQFTILDERTGEEQLQELLSELECKITKTVADVLQIENDEIGVNDNFFSDLGGTSLEYYLLSDAIQEQFGVDIKNAEGISLNSVKEIYYYIMRG